MLTPDQVAPLKLRPLKRSEYDQLVEVGALDENDKVELVRGAIVEMSPQKAAHSFAVHALYTLLSAQLGERASVRSQFPLALSDDSEPEPDVAVVPPGDYRRAHPQVAWLIVEVSDSTVRFDRTIKGPLYAQAGVAEYWIVNLAERVVEVHTQPEDDGYRQRAVVDAGGRLRSVRFPEVSIAVADVLP